MQKSSMWRVSVGSEARALQLLQPLTHKILFSSQGEISKSSGPEDLRKDSQWTYSWDPHNSGAAADTL